MSRSVWQRERYQHVASDWRFEFGRVGANPVSEPTDRYGQILLPIDRVRYRVPTDLTPEDRLPEDVTRGSVKCAQPPI